MSIIDTLFGDKVKVVKDVVDAVAGTVDKFVLTKQEKFDAEQRRLEQEYRFEALEQEAFQKQQDRMMKLYEVDAEDRKDARDFAKVEIASGDKFVAHFRYWFAATIVIIIFSMMALILFVDLPDAKKDIVMYILGTLTSTFTVVVSFYFGSSSGSSIKDQVIQSQSKEIGKQSAQ